jgi:hypothetical protein
MSTKTLRKRIALVAVTALGAGLLSVVAVPSASAAVPTTGEYDVTGLDSAINGNCFAYNTTLNVAAVNRNLISTVDIDASGTGVIAAGITNKVIVSVTGPGIITTVNASASQSAGDVADGTLKADGSSYTFTGDASVATDAGDVDVKLTGAGTVTVKTSYVTSSGSTPMDTITIYSLDKCDNGAVDLSKSSAEARTSAGNAATTQDTDGDATGASLRTFAESGYIALWLGDKYGNAIDTTGSYLTVSATNGALVGLDGGTPAAASAVTTTTPYDAQIEVNNGGIYTPLSTVVTISLNGAVLFTKSITFSGVASKIVLGKTPTLLDVSTANPTASSVAYTVVDSAGNRVAATAVAGSSLTFTNAGTPTNFYTTVDGTTGGGTTTTTSGYFDLVGGSAEGPSVATVRVLTAEGNYVVSDPIKYTTTTDAIDTFTVSLDKAIYNPGEVVTVTITAKNAKGNLVADGTALSTSGGLTVTPAGLTKVSVDPAYGDVSEGGAWVYKYYASTTPAAYGISVKTTSAATTTGSITAAFTVSAGSGVSNADVLKAIVSLIASINKQIAALQKALLRR